MLMTPMRVFPSLFVGRREVLEALEVEVSGATGQAAFTCGACEAVLMTAQGPEALRDVVLKCRCGEYNQL